MSCKSPLKVIRRVNTEPIPPAGIWLRKLRERHGWSYSFMSDLLSCSYQLISEVELGKRAPSPYFCEKLKMAGYSMPAGILDGTITSISDDMIPNKPDTGRGIIPCKGLPGFCFPSNASRCCVENCPRRHNVPPAVYPLTAGIVAIANMRALSTIQASRHERSISSDR